VGERDIEGRVGPAIGKVGPVERGVHAGGGSEQPQHLVDQVTAQIAERPAVHLAGDGDRIAGLVADGGRLASTLGFTGEGLTGRDLTVVPVMADPDDATLTRLAADAASGLIRVPITATLPAGAGREGVPRLRLRSAGQARDHAALTLEVTPANTQGQLEYRLLSGLGYRCITAGGWSPKTELTVSPEIVQLWLTHCLDGNEGCREDGRAPGRWSAVRLGGGRRDRGGPGTVVGHLGG